MAGKIIVPILSAFSAKGVNDAKASLGALKGALGDIGKSIAGGVAGGSLAMGAGDFMDTAINQARDLQRNMAAVNQVFGDFASTQKAFIKNSASMGLASSDAAKASVFVGSVLKQSGFTMDEVSGQTEKLVGLAADLAITYGYDVSEALSGMTALFRGEYDPIEKFGVAMKQAEVNAILTERGLNKLTGQEKLHAQQVIRMELLYARASDAMGAFKRQGDNLFAQQSILTAGFNNMAGALGEPLLAPLAHMAQMFSGTLDDIQAGWMPAFEQIGAIIEATAPIVKILGEVFAELGTTFSIIFQIIADAIDGVMPIFLGIWAALKPIIKAVNAVLSVLGTIVKAIMIPIKLIGLVIGIMLKVLGQFFDWLLGGVMGAALGGLGDAFGVMNGDLDTMNKTLDDIIANVFELKKANPVDETSRLLNRYLYVPVKKGPKELTDEQKRFIESVKKFKTELKDLLKGVMPGSMAIRQLGDFEKAVVDSFRSIYDKITQGLTDKILSSSATTALRKYSGLVQTELQQIASARDKLATKLDLGKALMADTKKAVKDFASLASIMSSTGNTVTKTVSYMVGKFRVTTSETVASVSNAATIISKFKDIVAKTKDFKTNLEKLQAMGLSGDIYTQILGLGLDQGGAMAKSILEGGQTAVTTLNGLQTEINGLGSQMGETAAQVMYGAGIDLTDGLVAGILAADDKLKAAAESLANTFKTTFDNAINGGGKTGGFIIPKFDTSYAETAIAASTYTAPSSTVVNIKVDSGVAGDPYAIGKTIVQFINQYARVSGPVTFV
jgi:hypothetical protein